nr:TetR/AcrR family transcriptional regulator C-terminal domain-containing protein [Arsenicicoccus piscis]
MTRTDVVAEALRILDSYGFTDLSMRRLATSLGVQPSALYWHIPNKQSLLAEMAQTILAEPIDSAQAPGADSASRLHQQEASWPDQVRAWATRLRAALRAHRDGAELVASVLAVRSADVDPAAPVVDILRRAGLAEADAAQAGATLLVFVLGAVADEQGHEQMQQFGVAARADSSAPERFAFGLDLLVAGLATRLPEGVAPATPEHRP